MQNINKYINEYQETGSHIVLDKLYKQYESVLINIAKYKSFKSGEDYKVVFSDTFMLFVSCLKNFDNTRNTKFKTYLISSSKFMFGKDKDKENCCLVDFDIGCINDNHLQHILGIRLAKEVKLFSVYVLLVNGLKAVDIGKKLNISKSTVYRRISKIKEVLKKVIEDYEN